MACLSGQARVMVNSICRSAYASTVRGLSERVVEAQRSLRILQAIRWDGRVEQAFFASGCRDLPSVTPEYYRARPLSFDPESKLQELRGIERDIDRLLGEQDVAGRLMRRMCREYQRVVIMLTRRGTRDFVRICRELYGSSKDVATADVTRLTSEIQGIAMPSAGDEGPLLPAQEVVSLLSRRLGRYFGSEPVQVRLSGDILANATANRHSIKIRRDACFTLREVLLLEAHEGWVHLGTTVNGLRQPVCTFLSKGPPSSTATQEGLAVVTEFLANASHPARVRCLTSRIEAVAMAEAGANFLEVYRYFLDQGFEPRQSYRHSARIFRGSLPEGCGPFAKDLSYGKGFVRIGSLLRNNGCLPGRMPLLFCGKTNLADLDALAYLIDTGLVQPPRFLPPPFVHLRALSA